MSAFLPPSEQQRICAGPLPINGIVRSSLQDREHHGQKAFVLEQSRFTRGPIVYDRVLSATLNVRAYNG